MGVEAESYANSLTGLTLLGTEKSMQQKNIEAIKTLLKIADEEGNILHKSWVQIMKCVSELDVLHLIKSKAVSDSTHFLKEKMRKKYICSRKLRMAKRIIIYQDSVRLDSEGNVHFRVGQFAQSARVFAAHHNINLRIPLVWLRIWNVLSPHCVKAGCHNSTNIGAYAINSLRQLALLFFEKEELANFQFQNKFLTPFQPNRRKSDS